MRMDGSDHGPAVKPGKHEVKHYQGRPVPFDGVERSRAVGRGHNREAVPFQVGAHEPDDLGVVVDDQDRAIREWRRRCR